jgi:hypothetical protein
VLIVLVEKLISIIDAEVKKQVACNVEAFAMGWQ